MLANRGAADHPQRAEQTDRIIEAMVRKAMQIEPVCALRRSNLRAFPGSPRSRAFSSMALGEIDARNPVALTRSIQSTFCRFHSPDR